MLESKPRRVLIQLTWLVLFVAFYWIFQLSQTDHFSALISLYSIAFVAYLYLIFQLHRIPSRFLWIGATGLYALAFLQVPYLSNDYFRFLWDGEMIHLGINPFDFTPNQLIHRKVFSDCYYLDLYAGMGELSQGNYSCYPTVNQFYFYFSTLFSNDIETNIFVMRIMVVASLFFGVYHLKAMLIHLEMDPKRVYFLVLNPLVLLETMGNLHFELVTVSFLFAALHLLLKNKFFFSAILFSAAVQVKLIPLLLLPYVLPYLGWKNTLRYSIYSGIGIGLLSIFYLNTSNIGNFWISLQLYFHQFEFDSFLLYPYIQFGYLKHGWNLTNVYAPLLAKWAFFLLLGIAWNRKKIKNHEMLKRMFWGMMVYYFLTSTVHPWYWVIPISLSLYHFSWSLILASFFAIFSYGLYEFGSQNDFRKLLACMNVLIMMVFFLELIYTDRWKHWKPKLFLEREIE